MNAHIVRHHHHAARFAATTTESHHMTTTTDFLAYPPVVLAPVREAEGEGAWESCDNPSEAEAWRVYVHPHGRAHYYRTRSVAVPSVVPVI